MTIKAIKSDEDYENALGKIEQLMELDPPHNSPESNELEILTDLVQLYEIQQVEITPPDPIEAIEFRMEQQNLAPRDLIPYLGSRSKVSDILSKNRPLSLRMIRALHNGLGIPAKVLLQETKETEDANIDWSRFPLQEMIARGWIVTQVNDIQDKAKDALKDFFALLGTAQPIVSAVLYRKTKHIRSGRSMDEYALAAWTAQIMIQAINDPPPTKYRKGTLDSDFLQKLVQLSLDDNGPILAINRLREIGIPVIVEPQLPKTYLDGAAIVQVAEMPVIGLTLRFDRIDNFWFSLMHELAHVALHLDEDIEQFFDDLELDLDVEVKADPLEEEADQFAREALIPEKAWASSAARKVPMAAAAISLASKLNIHPAIVAGRIRYELKAWRHLNNLVGHDEVRRLFPNTTWS